MKRNWLADLDFYLVAPFIILVVAVSLWLATAAAYENYRLAQTTDQLVRIVSLARDMRVTPEDTDLRVRDAFWQRLKALDRDNVEIVSPASFGRPAEYGANTPWGEFIRVAFYPAYGAMRLEIPLSSSICRRLLSIYAKDVGDLGLVRVDVRSLDPPLLWRKVYEEQKGAVKEMKIPFIYSGCGDEEGAVVSLTFSL